MKKPFLICLSICFALMLSSPIFAQKGGKGGKGNKGHDRRGDRGYRRDRDMNQNKDKDRDHQARRHNDNDRHRRYPHHWGGDRSGWSWHMGVGGFEYCYGPRYATYRNFYYPIAPWRPTVGYWPWTKYYYFYSADPCPIHRYIHEGYCEYYYDDDGGCEVFHFFP